MSEDAKQIANEIANGIANEDRNEGANEDANRILHHLLIGSGLPFTKMEATGNDFVVLDFRTGSFLNSRFAKASNTADELPRLASALCDRHFGIGSDGFILLKEPSLAGTDAEMVFLNPDGSEGGMCGNGARCFALFASSQGLVFPLRFSVGKNIYTADYNGDGISIDFPFELAVDPLNPIQGLDNQNENLYTCAPGTPHLCWILPDFERETSSGTVELAPLKLPNEIPDQEWMKRILNIRHHTTFAPTGTNVNLVSAVSGPGSSTDGGAGSGSGSSAEGGAGSGSKNVAERAADGILLNLLTFEKGVENFTLSCGTGAIASALSWDKHQRAQSPRSSDSPEEQTILLRNRGGLLQVDFQRTGETYHRIRLTGPANVVFSGVYNV